MIVDAGFMYGAVVKGVPECEVEEMGVLLVFLSLSFFGGWKGVFWRIRVGVWGEVVNGEYV